MGPSWFIHCMAWVRYFLLTNLNVIDTSMSFSPNCHSTLIESIRFWISNFSSVQYLTQYISIWITLLNARTSWILWNKTCYRPFLKILFASLICVSVHQNNWLYFSKITMNLQFFAWQFLFYAGCICQSVPNISMLRMEAIVGNNYKLWNIILKCLKFRFWNKYWILYVHILIIVSFYFLGFPV